MIRNEQHANEERSDNIGNKAACWDRFLAHAGFNTLFPPVLFTVIGNVSPSAIEAIAHFIGPHLPKVFPTINLGLSGLITGVETAVRSYTNSLEKKDELVHIPGMSLSRQRAVLLVVLGLVLQTAKGTLQEYDPESPEYTAMSYMLAKDSSLVVLSQLFMTIVADGCVTSFSAADGWGSRGVSALGSMVSSMSRSASQCLSSLFPMCSENSSPVSDDGGYDLVS